MHRNIFLFQPIQSVFWKWFTANQTGPWHALGTNRKTILPPSVPRPYIDNVTASRGDPHHFSYDGEERQAVGRACRGIPQTAKAIGEEESENWTSERQARQTCRYGCQGTRRESKWKMMAVQSREQPTIILIILMAFSVSCICTLMNKSNKFMQMFHDILRPNMIMLHAIRVHIWIRIDWCTNDTFPHTEHIVYIQIRLSYCMQILSSFDILDSKARTRRREKRIRWPWAQAETRSTYHHYPLLLSNIVLCSRKILY